MTPLEELLSQSTELPSLPEIYIRVSELLESNHSSAFEIGEAVQTDPSLTSKILKMLNSAYYGLPSEVTSISQAVSLLGRQQLKHILTGSVLSGMFKEMDSANFSMHDFWLHSIKTAIIARHLALQNASIIDHDAFFTAGLLHDIGRLVIVNEIPDAISDVEQLMMDVDIDVVTAENKILGFTHMDVSREIMKNWELPSMLVQCAIKHHETEHEGPFAIDTSIVYLANEISAHDLSMDEEEVSVVLDGIDNWQQTKCTLDQVVAACSLAQEQGQEVLESLGMVDIDISEE